MLGQTFLRGGYPRRLLVSFAGLWRSRDNLSFRYLRRKNLRYFFALPVSLSFANMQELLFTAEARLGGFDGKTLVLCAYCLGAGLLFAFSTLKI